MKLFRKGDLILAALVVAASAALLIFQIPSSSPQRVVITIDNQICRDVPLSLDQTIEIQGNTVVIEQGRVRMAQAGCPDKRCVRQGAISRAGQSIICLPARLVVSIEGGGGFDAVAQ